MASQSRVIVSETSGRMAKTDLVNYTNIGLVLASFVIALYMPFELFLLSYAILGPAHYLTEMSWLNKRQFFTKSSYDAWVLAAISLLLTSSAFLGPASFYKIPAPTLVCLGFGWALVFYLTGNIVPRLIGLTLVAVVCFISAHLSSLFNLFFGFVPSLIHVYVFTGIFILFGALKDKRRSGFLTLGTFLVCPLLYFVVQPNPVASSNYVLDSYWDLSVLNTLLLGIPTIKSRAEMDAAVVQVFYSPKGLIVGRLIAFAYTYHYLNWFSKTSVIKWHQVSARQLSVVTFLWIASIGIYCYDFRLGIRVLSVLSMLHVFLEFPLNHMSVIGIYRELHGSVAKRLIFATRPAGSLAD